MLIAIKKLLGLLTPREKRNCVILLGLMIVQTLLEAAGVVSIVPVLAVVANPALVRTNRLLSWLFAHGQFVSVNHFLIALSLGAFVTVVGSSAFQILTTYLTNRFTQMRQYTISVRVLEAYVRQPYSFYLNRNTADLTKDILGEVGVVVSSTLSPALAFIAYGLTLLVLTALLVWLDPAVALIIAVVLGGAYSVIFVAVHRVLGRIGRERSEANRDRFTAAAEVFGGIKDLKVLGREEAYLARFRRPAATFAKHYATFVTLSNAPRYLIEVIGFGGVLALLLASLATRHDLGAVLPLMGVYVFAGYRLLPAAQQVYNAATSVQFALPALEDVYREVMDDVARTKAAHAREDDPLPLTRGIRFESVGFQYPETERSALTSLNFTIEAGTVVALVGRTGAGKSTALDLILGLLNPTTGRIRVDDTTLTVANTHSWQRSIGYVPQTIYLADVSIAENIAFGIVPKLIDHAAVERAARLANLHDFIVTELPGGYTSGVGERGVRLSGGQRQRIGIARALYHNPSVLVLDEATGALDAPTEHAIMDAVQRLKGDKTIIMITHRMNTIRLCDQIVVLESGRLEAVGSFDELVSSNAVFRQLAVA